MRLSQSLGTGCISRDRLTAPFATTLDASPKTETSTSSKKVEGEQDCTDRRSKSHREEPGLQVFRPDSRNGNRCNAISHCVQQSRQVSGHISCVVFHFALCRINDTGRECHPAAISHRHLEKHDLIPRAAASPQIEIRKLLHSVAQPEELNRVELNSSVTSDFSCTLRVAPTSKIGCHRMQDLLDRFAYGVPLTLSCSTASAIVN
ncbi:sex-determining protein [Pseudozyma hubeiensis SY62]|uniref:Sex-determining protein n=1 Tax=Pseudozyma hubeiensis (strain SY62) TaxID=1305764 RepID=R9PBP0_PSEHS|nr:sex-determining protein [Pseudozyma hubeiensis SY62]GAC98657.1 sex-determining protein [Pseudozyma hubeiensis SY62]